MTTLKIIEGIDEDMTLIEKTLKSFDEEAKKWSKGQNGVCACLGNCADCGFHICHGCLCSFKAFITQALQEQDRESTLKANNKLITLLEKIKNIKPTTVSDEAVCLASKIYADIIIMALKQDEN